MNANFDEVVQNELRVVRELLERANVALEHLQNGRREEFLNEADGLYLESNKADARNALSFVRLIMIHLFKIMYGRDERSSNILNREIRNFRFDLTDILDWDKNKRNTRAIELVENEIEITYIRAVRRFQSTIIDEPSGCSIENISMFPTECPWTLSQLIDSSIVELILLFEGEDVNNG